MRVNVSTNRLPVAKTLRGRNRYANKEKAAWESSLFRFLEQRKPRWLKLDLRHGLGAFLGFEEGLVLEAGHAGDDDGREFLP